MRSFYIKLVSIFVISYIGILVYSNVFFCSFQFDDFRFIVENPVIRNIQDLFNIWQFHPYRFVTLFSFALNYHFDQLDVFGYHLFNLAVHLISAILVWWLTRLTLSTPAMKDNKITVHADLIALFAGLVFVSHPVQTESVAYIWQRTTSLAALFYVASLCFYVKSRLSQQKIYYICALITAIAAMFTKEMTATLPFMILLYEFSFLRTKKCLNWKYLVPFFLALLIISFTVMLLPKPIKAQEMQGVISGVDFISPVHYLFTQFRVMVTYIRLVFVPIDQNLDYDYPISNSLFELPTLISFLFIIITLFWAKRLFLKYRLISFSIFWFFLTLLPESSVIPLKDVIVEHRLYLPLVGYSLFLVSGLFYLGSFTSLRMTMVILTMMITCNSVLTYQRNKVWGDQVSLWKDAVRKSPCKARPYNNLGNAYNKQGNLSQAISDFTKAIEIDPHYAEAYYNRAITYYQLKEYSKAWINVHRAAELGSAISPDFINALKTASGKAK